MLSGSVLHGFGYGPDFSDACLQTMDNGFSFLYPPGPAERWGAESLSGVLAAALAGAAWLLVVLAARWSRTTRVVATLPALATWALAVFALVAAGSASRAELRVSTLLELAPNVLAVVAFVVIAVRERSSFELLPRVALLLAGTTAFGLIQIVIDYVVSTSLSDANWDTPPGAGYPTVAGMVLAAILIMLLTGRRPLDRPGPPVDRVGQPAGTPAG